MKPHAVRVQKTRDDVVQTETSKGARFGYRSELDGLRCVAVVLVVIFHSFENDVLPGGFLGVDLFFVLSGFLITRLLLEERLSRGRVSLSNFYRRRATRL